MSILNIPLLIKPNSTARYSPTYVQDIAMFPYSEQVEFHCPSSSILLKGNDTGYSWVLGTCTPKNNSFYSINDISCKGPKIPKTVYTPIVCATNSQLIRVFYELSPERLIYILTVCFKQAIGIALFTHHILEPFYFDNSTITSDTFIPIESLQRDNEIYLENRMPDFEQIYSYNAQHELVNNLLELENGSATFIDASEDYVFVPTFLTSPADYYDKDMQQVVKRFINVVPQWKIIKENNWNSVEEMVRQCIMTIRHPVKVWTGGSGIVKLRSYTIKRDRLVYLDRTDKLYPVPLFLWKLLYCPALDKAVVIIVFNNPHYDNTRVNFLCPDISNEVFFMKDIDQYNRTLGFSYVCHYERFRKVVSYLPRLKVKPWALRCKN